MGRGLRLGEGVRLRAGGGRGGAGGLARALLGDVFKHGVLELNASDDR